MVWYSHLFQNFPQFIVIHTVKGFGTVNKAEIDVFLELSCFFDDPADVVNLISGSSAFSKTSLNIRKFTVRILLKPGLESFEHYFTSKWDECNCAVVWAFFGIAFLGSVVKNSPANAGDLGLIPGLGRSPEKKMAIHSSILASEISWTEEPGRLQSMGWVAKGQIQLSN